MSTGTAHAMARANLGALEARTVELIARIERDTSDDERILKPAPKSWSLAEVTQHLALVAGGMLRTARDARSSAPFGAAKLALLTAVLRSAIRFPVPVAAIVPRPGVTWTDARTNAMTAIAKWKTFVEGESLDATAFRHPLVGMLTPVQTTQFLVEHFDHHTRQVDRLFAFLNTDRSSGLGKTGRSEK